MISGTYILTDTIDKAFNNIFTSVYAGTDAVITGKSAFGSEDEGVVPPPFAESLLEQVRGLPGVSRGGGQHQGLRAAHEPAGRHRRRRRPADPRFRRQPRRSLQSHGAHDRYVAGRGRRGRDRRGDGEGRGLRRRRHRSESSREGPCRSSRSPGLHSSRGSESLGGATFAVFTLAEAQRLFDKEGELDAISMRASRGSRPSSSCDEIEPRSSRRTPRSRPASRRPQEATKDIEEFTNIIRYFLLAFGFIALFVGAFVIFNTLSITVAQRVREFATLRTIGASRRQILGSVILEALVIGLLASLAGLFLGLGLAKGLTALFDSIGFDLPTHGPRLCRRARSSSACSQAFSSRSSPALFPAIRATRVPPIAAVREGATLPSVALAPLRAVDRRSRNRSRRRSPRLRDARRRHRRRRSA